MIQEIPSGLAIGKAEITRPRRLETCPRWTFQFTRGIQGLIAIESLWEDLADSDPHLAFYQCPAWAHAYLEHLAPDPEALVWVTGWRDRQLELVLPLEQVGSDLCLLRHDHMTLADALAPSLDNAVWPQLRAWMSGPDGPGNMRLRFPAIPSHAVLERWLGLFPESLALQRNLDGSAWLSCDRSYSEILKGASANHRSNLSRGLKRAAKLGTLLYESFSHPDELAAALPHFLSIEASGWKGKQGGAVACKAELVVAKSISSGSEPTPLRRSSGSEPEAFCTCRKSLTLRSTANWGRVDSSWPKRCNEPAPTPPCMESVSSPDARGRTAGARKLRRLASGRCSRILGAAAWLSPWIAPNFSSKIA